MITMNIKPTHIEKTVVLTILIVVVIMFGAAVGQLVDLFHDAKISTTTYFQKVAQCQRNGGIVVQENGTYKTFCVDKGSVKEL